MNFSSELSLCGALCQPALNLLHLVDEFLVMHEEGLVGQGCQPVTSGAASISQPLVLEVWEPLKDELFLQRRRDHLS